MENPASWGPAEKVVAEVIAAHEENLAKPIIDRQIGWSLPKKITHALDQAGLLASDGPGRQSPPASG